MYCVVQSTNPQTNHFEVYVAPNKWIINDSEITYPQKNFDSKRKQLADPKSSWVRTTCKVHRKNLDLAEADKLVDQLDNTINTTAEESTSEDECKDEPPKRRRIISNNDTNLNDIFVGLRNTKEVSKLIASDNSTSSQIVPNSQSTSSQITLPNSQNTIDSIEFAPSITLDTAPVIT